jgi:integration host factor subunit alpha
MNTKKTKPVSSTSALTRADIINTVNKEVGLSQTICSHLLDDLINEIKESLRKEKVIKITRFGSFHNKRKKERKGGRNPKTKEEFIIPARNVVTFTASNHLKARLNTSNNSKDKS